jgi:hypothetical protein
MKTKPKSATNEVTDKYPACDSGESTSIPLEKVEKMIQCAVERNKAERTIYDDRNDLLDELRENEMTLEHYEQCVHNATLHNQEIKKSIAQINTAIRRELELNR